MSDARRSGSWQHLGNVAAIALLLALSPRGLASAESSSIDLIRAVGGEGVVTRAASTIARVLFLDQQHSTEETMSRFTLMAAAAVFTIALGTSAAAAQDTQQDRRGIRQDTRGIRQDRRELFRDNRDIPQDRRDIQKDTRDLNQDRSDIRKDRRDIAQDRRELRQDLKSGDLDAAKAERAEIQKDRRDLARDRKDLRGDARDRNQDRRELNRDLRDRRTDQRDLRHDKVVKQHGEK